MLDVDVGDPAGRLQDQRADHRLRAGALRYLESEGPAQRAEAGELDAGGPAVVQAADLRDRERAQLAQQGVALRAIGADHSVHRRVRCQRIGQLGDFFRRVLQVVVHGHDHVAAGVLEAAEHRAELPHVLLRLRNSPLHVLPAGTVPADPLGALVSGRLEETITELRRRFHRIVIDTPPIVPFTDADLLARFADGALIVARAGSTRKGELLQAIASMTGAPVVGTLLNDATHADAD